MSTEELDESFYGLEQDKALRLAIYCQTWWRIFLHQENLAKIRPRCLNFGWTEGALAEEEAQAELACDAGLEHRERWDALSKRYGHTWCKPLSVAQENCRWCAGLARFYDTSWRLLSDQGEVAAQRATLEAIGVTEADILAAEVEAYLGHAVVED